MTSHEFTVFHHLSVYRKAPFLWGFLFSPPQIVESTTTFGEEGLLLQGVWVFCFGVICPLMKFQSHVLEVTSCTALLTPSLDQ